MSFSLVQKAGYAVATGGGSPSVAYPGNVTQNNLLVAFFHADTTGAPAVTAVTISDTQGNTWTPCGIPGAQDTNMIYWAIAKSTGANTATANVPSGTSRNILAIAEYSGVLASHPLSQFGTSEVSGNPSGGVYEFQAGSLIVSQIADNGNSSTYNSPVNITNQTTLSSGTWWGDIENGAAGENSYQATQTPTPDSLTCTASFLPSTYVKQDGFQIVRTSQKSSGSLNGTQSSVTTLFPGGNNAGNLILVIVDTVNFSTNQVTGVTDTAGNSYSLLTSFHGAVGLNNFFSVYAANGCLGTNAPNKITVAVTNQSYSNLYAFAIECSGQATSSLLDATGSSGSATQSYTVTATAAKDLLLTLIDHATGGQTYTGYSGTVLSSLATTTNNGTSQIPLSLTLTQSQGNALDDSFFAIGGSAGAQTITVSSSGVFVSFTAALKAAPAASAPTFSPPAGSYSFPQTVSLGTTSSGATIYYTTDGSTPTRASNVYSGPITVNNPETIKAIAADGGFNASPVATASYASFSSGVGFDYGFSF